MTRGSRVKTSVLLSLTGAASLVLTTTTNRIGGLILRRLAREASGLTR